MKDMTEQDHIQQAASGLYCSTGRDVFRRDGQQGTWQFVLPDAFDMFGSELLERPQPSPDGKHLAFVALCGQERHVCIAALPGPVIRALPRPLTGVHGMSWSPDGSRLCVIAGDPAIGILSIDRDMPQANLSVFSMFVAGADDTDLAPVAGPIVLPGIPRWSPAGDAVAVVGQDRAGGQVLLIVTVDGQMGTLMTGRRILLGSTAWTAGGHLLCAVTGRDNPVHLLLINAATGAVREVDRPWDDVCWLSLLGQHVLVAGRSGTAWSVTETTRGARTALTDPFPGISDVAAGPEGLWVVAQTEEHKRSLWSVDLQGGQPRLHAAAASILDLRIRQDGTAAAVLAGAEEAETVCIYAVDVGHGLDIGHRDGIMGWLEAQPQLQQLPHLSYLLEPSAGVPEAAAPEQPAPVPSAPPEEAVKAEEPAAPGGPPVPPEQPSAAAQVRTEHAVEQPAPVPSPRPHRRFPGWIIWAAAVVLVIAVIWVAVAMVSGGLSWPGTATNGTPSTPSVAVEPSATPSVVPETPSIVEQPSAPSVTPHPPVVTPSVPAVSPSTGATTPSAPVPGRVPSSGGIAVGSWTAATETVHVRQGAGTDQGILGSLLPSGRARVVAGPVTAGGMSWWKVCCYDAGGRQTLTGWVSGTYLKSAAALPVTPGTFTAPARGTLQVTSTPAGAAVTVDGHAAGTTPATLPVAYGTHTVVVSMDGYLQYETSVTVRKPSTAAEVQAVHVAAPLMKLTTGG